MTNNERYDSVLEIACPVSVGVFPSVLNEWKSSQDNILLH
jgi:hypothetical protein